MRASAILIAALGLAAGGAAAQEIKWNVGFVNAVGSSYLVTLKTVPQRIATATNGRLKIDLFDTLVAGPEQPAAVRDGRLDASFAVSPWLSAEAPYINFGHLPGLLTDVGTYQKMLDPLLREEMAKVWRAKYNAVQLATGVFEDQCHHFARGDPDRGRLRRQEGPRPQHRGRDADGQARRRADAGPVRRDRAGAPARHRRHRDDLGRDRQRLRLPHRRQGGQHLADRHDRAVVVRRQPAGLGEGPGRREATGRRASSARSRTSTSRATRRSPRRTSTSW